MRRQDSSRRYQQYQYEYPDDEIEEEGRYPKQSGDEPNRDKKNPNPKHTNNPPKEFQDQIDNDNDNSNLEEEQKIDSEEQEQGQPQQYRMIQQEEIDIMKSDSSFKQSGKPYEPNNITNSGSFPVQEEQAKIFKNPPQKPSPPTIQKPPGLKEEPTQTDNDYMNPNQITFSIKPGEFPSFSPDKNPSLQNPNQSSPSFTPNMYPNLPLKPPQPYPKGQMPNARQYPPEEQPGDEKQYYPPQSQMYPPQQPNRTKKPKKKMGPNYRAQNPYPANPNYRNPRDVPQRQGQRQQAPGDRDRKSVV